MNYKDVLHNEEVKAFLKKANENLGVLGYTDHSEKHCAIVAKRAGMILSKFEYPEHEIELAEIAGAMHDIGNAINRNNHDESTGGAIDVISAALILADKTDVRRNRVRSKDKASFDKHDRVNYAVTNAAVKANMMMCRGAAELLGAKFKLTANGSKVL